MWTSTWGWTPLPPSTCVHLSLTPSPLRVDVINGWPLKQNAEIQRVKSMKILGIIPIDELRDADHVVAIVNTCSRSQYALRILKAQTIHKLLRQH